MSATEPVANLIDMGAPAIEPADSIAEREPIGKEVSEEKPLAILRARKGFSPIPFAELIQFRDLLVTLAIRDVKLRYRQTALGAVWVILQPLIGAGVFTFVFGTVAKLPSQGIPYFAFAFAGLLGWNTFANTMTKASASLVGNGHLVSKVYFPRLILPLSTTFGVLIDFAVGLGMMLVLLLLNHIPFTWHLAALPGVMIMALMMALGIGNFFASLMVTYRDVQYVVPVLAQFLMYASPVAYSAAAVPHRVRVFYSFNPLVGLMESFHWSLLGPPVANWGVVAYSAVFSVVIFIVGALAFQRMERRFADII